jgi:hypothetical protein
MVSVHGRALPTQAREGLVSVPTGRGPTKVVADYAAALHSGVFGRASRLNRTFLGEVVVRRHVSVIVTEGP